MMRITPLDIRKQPFRKVLMGFDPDAVNSFLEMVAAEFEESIRERNDAATRLKVCEQRLEQYERIEKTLNETLMTAQRATDDARANAQREAELILKDAQVRADRYEDEARRRVHQLESDLVALRSQRDSFLARFKAMLRTQLELLGAITEGLGGAGSRELALGADETLDEVPSRDASNPFDVIGDNP